MMLKLLTCFLWIFITSANAHEVSPIKDADGNILPHDIRILFQHGVITKDLPAGRETVPYPNLTLDSLSQRGWTNHKRQGVDVYIEDGDNTTVLQTKISEKTEQSYFVGNVSKGSRNIAVVSRVNYPINAEDVGKIKEKLTDIILRKNHHEWLVPCSAESEATVRSNSSYSVPKGYELFAIVNDTDANKKLIRKSESAPEKDACHSYALPAIRTYLLSNNNGKLKKFKTKGLSCTHLLSDCDAP